MSGCALTSPFGLVLQQLRLAALHEDATEDAEKSGVAKAFEKEGMTTAEVTAERNNILECIDSLKRTLDDEEDPELQLVLEQSIKDEKIKLKEYTSTSSVSGGKRRARSTKKQRQTQLKKKDQSSSR